MKLTIISIIIFTTIAGLATSESYHQEGNISRWKDSSIVQDEILVNDKLFEFVKSRLLEQFELKSCVDDAEGNYILQADNPAGNYVNKQVVQVLLTLHANLNKPGNQPGVKQMPVIFLQ